MFQNLSSKWRIINKECIWQIEELTTIQQEAEKSSLEQMEAYMGESDKQFQQLKLHLQEKNDVIAVLQQDKETLQNEASCSLSRVDFLVSRVDIKCIICFLYFLDGNLDYGSQ